MAVRLANPLHLYRSLLRECSYLPDSQARTYLHDHVISSFRRYVPTDPKKSRERIPLARQVSLLRRGRHGLSVLGRANQGYLRPLQHILLLTYGRKGRRRRQLMAKMVEPDIPPDHRAVEALPSSRGERGRYSRQWEPPSKLVALLRSQDQQAGNIDRIVGLASKLKVRPAIPETNTWGRPMPQKRVRNLMREWYAKQLSRLLPPLPEHEHRRLHELAVGKIGRDEGPRPRRKPALSLPGSTVQHHPLLNERLVLEGPPKSHTFEVYAQGRPHRLTLRFLKRVWATIYKHVPQMTWHQATQKWRVTWDVQCKPPAQVLQISDDQFKMLFDRAT